MRHIKERVNRGLTKEYLNECFEYKDGRLFWKERPRHHFKTDKYHMFFNEKYAGHETFGHVNSSHGYCQGGLDGHNLLRGYIVYTMFNGPPTRSIRRKDGDRCNDHISNLYQTGESV